VKRKNAHRLSAVVLLAALTAAACNDSTGPQGHIVEGVNLTQLFAPPSNSEINAVLTDWAGRDVSPKDVQVELTDTVTIGATDFTISIVSHTVGGVKHYGAVMEPLGAAAGSLPLLMYSHGGDGGIDIDELIPLIPLILGDLSDDFVLVAPSFRDEPLIYDGTTYKSEGPPSPWDYDVDDALALINATLDGVAPAADAGHIGVVGFSRGACVGMLMAERNPSIHLVVEFFGPTDFFGPFVQDVTEEALRGTLRDLPGLEFLNDEYIQPLKLGEKTIQEVRDQMVRRSPVYFANRLPQLQVHHGTADETVLVGEAERLIEVMVGLGRREPEFESYIYDGGGHHPLTLSGSIPRTQAFVSRLLSVTLAVR
jgi:dipeptidyl aminopeptidase/acylaminoacyl peptidase